MFAALTAPLGLVAALPLAARPVGRSSLFAPLCQVVLSLRSLAVRAPPRPRSRVTRFARFSLAFARDELQAASGLGSLLTPFASCLVAMLETWDPLDVFPTWENCLRQPTHLYRGRKRCASHSLKTHSLRSLVTRIRSLIFRTAERLSDFQDFTLELQ